MKSDLVWDVMPFSPVEIYHSFIRLLPQSLGWKIKPCGGNNALCRKCRKEPGTTGKPVEHGPSVLTGSVKWQGSNKIRGKVVPVCVLPAP